MIDKEKNEVIFDALLKVAVSEALEKEVSLLPSDEEIAEFQPTPEFDGRMKKLFQMNQRKASFQRMTKKVRKIAACVGILFTLSATLLLSVSATRNAILNAVIGWQEKYTEVKFDGTTEDSSTYLPSYLPEGYSKTSDDVSATGSTTVYTNSAGNQIILTQSPADSGADSVDNENTTYREINLSIGKAYLFEAKTADDSSVLIWQYNSYAFELSAQLNSTEMVKIAESLKK
jgi:hypothetical protein